jgi:hypothetical protein
VRSAAHLMIFFFWRPALRSPPSSDSYSYSYSYSCGVLRA